VHQRFFLTRTDYYSDRSPQGSDRYCDQRPFAQSQHSRLIRIY